MFIISILLLVQIFATKLAFVLWTRGGTPGWAEYGSIVVLVAVILSGMVNYFRDRKNFGAKNKSSQKKLYVWVSVLIFLLITLSFFISFGKKAVMWDAVALYDARAKFLGGGMNFSQMVGLSEFDPYNSYYYALYPPHTSLVHHAWRFLNIPAPVGVYYSINLLFLAVVVYIAVAARLGKTAGAAAAFLTISTEAVFMSSILEYTNLPFTLNLVLGIFLLNEFLGDKKLWKLLFGAVLIITSMWIRFLEPIWGAIILAFAASAFLQKKLHSYLVYVFLFALYGIIEYISWQSFVSGLGAATKIVEISALGLLEPALGLFTGAAASVFIFFAKSWGITLFTHAFAVFGIWYFRKRINFLQIVILSSVSVYYAALYFVSFQTQWWSSLGESLKRGPVFLIPIAAYVILEYISEYAKKGNSK